MRAAGFVGTIAASLVPPPRIDFSSWTRDHCEVCRTDGVEDVLCFSNERHYE
jgi:hypothetical protein